MYNRTKGEIEASIYLLANTINCLASELAVSFPYCKIVHLISVEF